MNKTLYSILLILVISVAAAARLTIMGWVFLIAVVLLVIFSFFHVFLHLYFINRSTRGTLGDILLIVCSHLCFLCLCLFQSDGGDDRGYVIFEYILGKDKTLLGKYSEIIMGVSFIIYVVISVLMWLRAKKSGLKRAKWSYVILALVACLLLSHVFLWGFNILIYSSDMKKMENTGIYTDISRALKDKDKVRELRIDSFDVKLTSFPREVLELENLNELYLTGQSINSIPDDIGRLKNVEVIDLTDNNINVINPSICDCKNLKDLRIGGDSILTLPDCLTEMDSLTNLTIQSNSANTLMDELRKFKNLKTAHFYLKEGLFDREKWWRLVKEIGIE